MIFQGQVDQGWQLLLTIATSKYSIYEIASPQQPLLLHPFLNGIKSEIKQSGTVYEMLDDLYIVSLWTNGIVKTDTSGLRRIEYGHYSAEDQSDSAINPGSYYDLQMEEQEFTDDEMNVLLQTVSRKSTDSVAET